MFLYSVNLIRTLNIAVAYRLQISSKYPEAQRQLWGRLSLGQIGKLAAATKQAAVCCPNLDGWLG